LSLFSAHFSATGPSSLLFFWSLSISLCLILPCICSFPWLFFRVPPCRHFFLLWFL
jgi:hypothetical protein